MPPSVETVVAEHTITLGFIVGTMTEVKDTLKEISLTQRKMEVLMERQSNHEEHTRSSFINVHKRIDEHEQEEKERIKADEAFCKVVEINANNGNKAYSGLMWLLTSIGVLAVGTLYTKVWG